MDKNSRVFIAGANGLVGSSITRSLTKEGYQNLLTPSSKEVDLTDIDETEDFFQDTKPEYVFLCAAKVGGIVANRTYPLQFIRNNLLIQLNTMQSSWYHGVKKLLFLGSSCIYPKHAQQPIREEYLLSGKLEETNKPYAVAKVAGLTLCEAYRREEGCNFIAAMPTNLYGPGDNFDPISSHVLPGLMRKFHDALPDKPVTLWGTGKPRREFLYIDDLAEACILLMQEYNSSEIINIGTGEDIEILALADVIQKAVGHTGSVHWDSTMPDGTPRKLLDVTKIKSLGWEPKVQLSDGIRRTYEWFLKHQR